jgi:hypothetical protein
VEAAVDALDAETAASLEAFALFADMGVGGAAATSVIPSLSVISCSASSTSMTAGEVVAVASGSSISQVSPSLSAAVAAAVGRTSWILFCGLFLLRCAFPRAFPVFFGIVTHSLYSDRSPDLRLLFCYETPYESFKRCPALTIPIG